MPSHKVLDRSRIEYASEELLARFDQAKLHVEPMGADYVYDVNRMIDLAGGDLSSKRQAKNRFMRNYEHRVEAYDAATHREECLRLLECWKDHQDAQHEQEPNRQRDQAHQGIDRDQALPWTRSNCSARKAWSYMCATPSKAGTSMQSDHQRLHLRRAAGNQARAASPSKRPI